MFRVFFLLACTSRSHLLCQGTRIHHVFYQDLLLTEALSNVQPHRLAPLQCGVLCLAVTLFSTGIERFPESSPAKESWLPKSFRGGYSYCISGFSLSCTWGICHVSFRWVLTAKLIHVLVKISFK